MGAQATERPPGPIARFLLAGCGLGWLRPGPGTFGSLATALVLTALAPWTGVAWGAAMVCVVAGAAVCIAFAGRIVGSDGHGDPGWIVADEVAGQAVAIGGALPFVAGHPLGLDAWPMALAFASFRLFDIAKPGSIRALERLPGGLGVLADDIGAGLLAAGLTALACVVV